MRPVVRRLDLDGTDFLAVGDDEVDLVVAGRSRLGSDVVEQAPSVGGKLLGDDVLIDHAEVHGQLVRQADFVHVLLVQVDDHAFHVIYRKQVVRPQQRVHGLGHAAHEHVKPEVAHELAAESLPQWPARGEGLPQQGNRGVVAARPQELLEIHRTHPRAFLVTGDEDVPGVPVYQDERTGLDVVVTAVPDELFDGLPRPRTHLDLVEYDQRLPVEQPGRIPQLELEEQVVEVGHVVEQFADITGRLGEIYEYVAAVLAPGELLHDGRLAHTPRALDQHGRPALGP